MDLSKDFECITHDSFNAILHTYGLSQDAVTFVYSYLKRRKQGVKKYFYLVHIRPNFIQYFHK